MLQAHDEETDRPPSAVTCLLRQQHKAGSRGSGMPAVARRSHGVATSATVSGPFVVALVVHPVHHIGCYGTRPRRSTEESSSELDSVSKFDIKISASL